MSYERKKGDNTNRDNIIVHSIPLEKAPKN
jgi:hypothetical protein